MSDASGSVPLEREGAVVRTRGLTKQFGKLIAVDSVDLTVSEHEFHSIIGPNGAGKTTLFNLITGTIPSTSGKVYYAGTDVTKTPLERIAQMGMVRSFQTDQLFNNQSVYDNVRIASQTGTFGQFKFDILSKADDFRRGESMEILELLGLASHRDELAKNLSHGDQRRLGIAIMLATSPDTLLLDEPTSGMDPKSTAEFVTLIEDIQSDYNLTIIMIEHDMNVVLDVSDRISVLYDGSILATGTVSEIQDNPAVQEAYLGGFIEAQGGLE